MKLNYETCLVGTKCVLVPYRQIHVERYHAWMQSPDLLQATGSEPLSLQEEYEMQESWRTDENKCTFIVLQRNKLSRGPPEQHGQVDDEFIFENIGAMVGDVNLFLSEQEEEESSDEQPVEPKEDASRGIQAELDIMVAEESARGQGIGLEACCLMMLYGIRHLAIRRFFCKINQDNHASLSLFQKLKFTECDYAECFKQYEYELKQQESPEDLAQCLTPFVDSTDLRTIQCASDVIVSN